MTQQDQSLPQFDQPPETETPAPPKKPRQKPVRKRKVRKAVAAPVPKKRRAKKRRVARKVVSEAVGINHAEFQAAWNVVASLSKFDNDAKKRILAKAAEAWT